MAIPTESQSTEIALKLSFHFQELNIDQRRVVTHDRGPLLVIAGPGSGKTKSLTLRAMNLLLLGKAAPSELVLCTYTEKAAFEMQDRIFDIGNQVSYNKDISQMRIGTIHSICNQIIMEHLHRLPNYEYQRPPIGNNYETLDQLRQCLFIFGHLDSICGVKISFFMNRWGTKWNIAKQLQIAFDKITEELIDIKELLLQPEPFLQNLAHAYRTYQNLLFEHNRVDFAHLQKIAYSLLSNSEISHHITQDIRYVLVDEYQDTNYIQEQILNRLVSNSHNICVVGDEDQSLYRFRGATVQNIRKFVETFRIRNDDVVYLTTNYRSHPKIIDVYNFWMTSINWGHFRSDKWIQPQAEKVFSEYPAVLSIRGRDAEDEAYQFAEFVAFLKEEAKVTDCNQIALLLYSVKEYRSNVYVKALEKRGIPVFCPRAGTYFDQEEVALIIGCFARIFHYTGGLLSDIVGHYRINEYLNGTISLLGNTCRIWTMLEATLQELEIEIAQLTEGKELDKQLADYFYHILSSEPFVTFTKDKDENKMRNLVIFSQILQTFQNYYHYNDISYENREKLISDFFNNFLCLLYEDGINQYENPEQPFPTGCIPVMTIHQAKGLEFPVVVVASLDRQLPALDSLDKTLRRYYRRSKTEQSILPEPDRDIPLFDFMRLYYVAFSRAMNLLVLMGNLRRKPSWYFNKILQEVPLWRDVQLHQLYISSLRPHNWKPRYSFTGHIRMYEICPRQYQFYREYQFVQSHPQETFFGLLVHGTIEKIHRAVIDGELATLTEPKLRELFEQTCYFLSQTNMRSLDSSERERAFGQVMNYFLQNKSELQHVTKSEESISIVKDKYILTGKIDAILEQNGTRAILDLKTSKPPEGDSDYFEIYEKQLCMYAHALEQRDETPPERLLLYWTAKPHKKDALMVIPYQAEKVQDAVEQFEDVVAKIKAKDFDVVTPPYPDVCKRCDMRNLCMREGLIERC